MTITYSNVPMKFDADKFGKDLQKELLAITRDTGYSTEEIAIVELDVSPSTVWTWVRGNSGGAYKQPSMTNFLKVCNCFGFDPRNYFIFE